MNSNIEQSENNVDICKFEKCNRLATYRLLKVGNCHLKNTSYDFVLIIDQRIQSINDFHTKQF